MIYVILAVIGGHIYASRIGWHSLQDCEKNLRPSISYLIQTTQDPNVNERCVDIDNAMRFMLKSSEPFKLFPEIAEHSPQPNMR